jgi:phosphatidylglycerol:prolipoprotein diacylglycerol transferase
MAVALVAGTIVAVRLGKRAKARADDIFDYAIVMVLASIIFARAAYVLLNLQEFRGGGAHVLRLWEGGLSFHGGVIGGLLATFFVSLWKKIPALRLCDIAAPGVALGYAITRIGCFLNGCCYGAPTSLFLGVRFHDATLPGGLTPPSHPTQLYSSAANLIIFYLLLRLFAKSERDGQVFFWYFVLYAIYRFAVEFLRAGVTAKISLWGLTQAQWASIVMLIVGIAGLLFVSRRGRERPRDVP